MKANNELETIFSAKNIDQDCNKIADLMQPVNRNIFELLDIDPIAEQLKNDPNTHFWKLMRSAITYMLNDWKHLIEYTNDGNYTIDNSLAELSIRPFTIERKNFVSFVSEEGHKTAAVYYTFVETCKMRGISLKDYFTDFFREILTGRRDYEALVPAIIG